MSRIGKQPINIPESVSIQIETDNIVINGPRGELSQKIHPKVSIDKNQNQLIVSVKDPSDKAQRSLWGLFQRLISNMVKGVTEGFSRQLEVNGVGYKVALKGDVLDLQLGYSHPIEYNIPKDIEIKVEKNLITILGADKQKVGQIASEIRLLRKPEPYKGKGIKYLEEIIHRKVGKTSAKGS